MTKPIAMLTRCNSKLFCVLVFRWPQCKELGMKVNFFYIFTRNKTTMHSVKPSVDQLRSEKAYDFKVRWLFRVFISNLRGLRWSVEVWSLTSYFPLCVSMTDFATKLILMNSLPPAAWGIYYNHDCGTRSSNVLRYAFIIYLRTWQILMCTHKLLLQRDFAIRLNRCTGV